MGAKSDLAAKRKPPPKKIKPQRWKLKHGVSLASMFAKKK